MTRAEFLREAEREYWRQLYKTGKSSVEIARISGVNRTAVYKMLKKLGLDDLIRPGKWRGMAPDLARRLSTMFVYRKLPRRITDSSCCSR